MMRKWVRGILVIAMAVLPVGMATASERGDVLKVVRQWVESLNKGDVNTAVAACARETVIIDEFSPHVWHGVGACSRWAKDLVVHNRAAGLVQGVVTLGSPWRVDITADTAYVVNPVDYIYTAGGKSAAEVGAIFTVALHKERAGWRITGWAWSRPYQ
jgi:hypothetical protein